MGYQTSSTDLALLAVTDPAGHYPEGWTDGSTKSKCRTLPAMDGVKKSEDTTGREVTSDISIVSSPLFAEVARESESHSALQNSGPFFQKIEQDSLVRA